MRSQLPFEKELEPVFLDKFPAFPESVKEFLAKFGPYFILVLSIIAVVGLLFALGIGSAALGMGAMPAGIGFNFYMGIALGIITLIMYIMAFPRLRARKRTGWNLLYYALLIGVFSNLVQLSWILALTGGIIGFWVLFQIREKYIF